MCRVAYITNKVARDLGIDGLTKYLASLERKMGGDGNGIGFFIGGEPRIIKGLELRTIAIAHIIDNLLDENIPFLFHTRAASSGPKCDELCHPFAVNHDGQKYLLGMNGTWTGYTAALWPLMHRIDDKKAVSDSLVLAHAVSEWGTDVIPLSEAGAIFLMDSDGVFTGYKTKHWPVDIGDGIVASDLPVGYKDEARIFSGGIVRMYPDGEFEVLEKGKSNSVNVVRSYGGYTNQYGQGYQRGGYQRPKAQSPAKAGHSKVVGEVKPKDTEDTTKVEDEDESIIFLADGKDTFYKYMHDDWWLTTDGGKTFTSIDAVDWQEVPNGDDDTPPPNYDPETDFGAYGEEITDEIEAYYRALGQWGHG